MRYLHAKLDINRYYNKNVNFTIVYTGTGTGYKVFVKCFQHTLLYSILAYYKCT